MARFSISAYNSDGRCKVCWSLASEHHHEGCELGAVYVEIKEMRLVIEQFLKLLGVETITSAFAKIATEVNMKCYCGHPKSMHDSDGDERQEKFWCNGKDCDCGRFIPFRESAEQSVHPTLPCTCWKDEDNVVHIDPACRRHPQTRASG